MTSTPWLLSLFCAALLYGGCAAGQDSPPPAAPPDAVPRTARIGGLELSGAIRVEGGLLMVDDEQVGTLMFVPTSQLEGSGELVAVQTKLERSRKDSQPFTKFPRLFAVQDIEDLAGDGEELVYVVGSHASRLGSEGLERRVDREFLIRARWRARDRVLRVRTPEDDDDERGLYTDLLRDLDRVDPALAGQPINVEGLALKGKKQLYLGLRYPLTKAGHAVVVRAKVDHLFGDAKERRERKLELMTLDLKTGGVRALHWDRAKDRLLVLSGAANADALTPPPQLWSCDEDGGELKLLHTFAGEHVRTLGVPEGVCRLDATRLLVACDKADGSGGGVLLLSDR